MPAGPPARSSSCDDLRINMDGASCIGPWSYDPATDRLRLSARLAARLGLAPHPDLDSDQGSDPDPVAMDTVLFGIHPADRHRIESVLHEASGLGLPFEAEFRTGRGVAPRWLRLMGRADPVRPAAAAPVRGLAFDLTESRIRPGTAAQHQANQLADHVVAMQGLVSCLHNPVIADCVEVLGKLLGAEIARHLTAGRLRSMH